MKKKQYLKPETTTHYSSISSQFNFCSNAGLDPQKDEVEDDEDEPMSGAKKGFFDAEW